MRIAIISDIHEDIVSLLQAERIIEKKKCDIAVCLGDIVGYSIPFYNYLDTRSASACVKWVKENCKYVVAGNHDLYAVQKIPQSKVRHFSYPKGWYKLSYAERLKEAKNAVWLYEDNELSPLLNDDEKGYLRELPEVIIADCLNTKYLFTHFIYPDISGSAKEFIYAHNDVKEHLNFMDKKGCALSFSGHMHYTSAARLTGKNLHKVPYGKKTHLNHLECISVPPITSAGKENGFVIWDVAANTIEVISLRKRFKFL